MRYAATKIADGTEPATLTVTMSAGSLATGMLYGISGAASATPLNTAVSTGNGYVTTLTPPSLTIAGPSDLTIYGYGGDTLNSSASPVVTALSNAQVISNGAHSVCGGIGWGTDVTSPGNGSSTVAMDEMNWAMDLAAGSPGAGGNAGFAWPFSTPTDCAVAMMSFRPAGAPLIPSPVMSSF